MEEITFGAFIFGNHELEEEKKQIKNSVWVWFDF
jgi:hypothetical protein